jgi:sulfide:quinone oxidoreductase
MQSKTILVLGGGIGGIVSANAIRRQLPAIHRVVLVEKNSQHAFSPSFLWLMTGDRRPEQIRRPLADLLRRGVELQHAEVTGIEPAQRQVRTSISEIAYDYLVVALGADLDFEAIPGLARAAHSYFTFDGALRLRDALNTFRGGRIAVVVSSLPYKCPAAPHEGAMLIADFFRRNGLSAKVDIHLFTPEPQPMPVAGPQVGEAVRGMLQAKNIEFHPLHKLRAVEPEAREMTFENGSRFGYDLLVAIPPHRATKVVVEAGLTNQTGWIPVEPATLRTTHEDVYAIGDATAIPIPGRWKPEVPLMLPKAGVFAHAQAEVVAERIVAAITGRPSGSGFSGDGYCMLEAGEQRAGLAFGQFFAEPAPGIQLRRVAKSWHLGKVLFEKWWLSPPGVRRSVTGWAMKTGGRLRGIPITL